MGSTRKPKTETAADTVPKTEPVPAAPVETPEGWVPVTMDRETAVSHHGHRFVLGETAVSVPPEVATHVANLRRSGAPALEAPVGDSSISSDDSGTVEP